MSRQAESGTQKRRGGKDATVAIQLEHGRSRHLGWLGIGVAGGVILLLFLGAVGKVIGLLLLLMALASGVSVLRTLRHEAGTIRIAADHAELPAGLCRGEIVKVPLAELKHAYMLRRALPLSRAGPVLAVETERGSFAYPRDWFASESDQRRVEMAINRRLTRED